MRSLCDTCMHRSMNNCPCMICPDMMNYEIENFRMMMPGMRTVDMSEDFGIEEIDDSPDDSRTPVDEKRILEKIERNNPEIMQTLIRHNIPYASAKRMIERIIYLTLYYSKH